MDRNILLLVVACLLQNPMFNVITPVYAIEYNGVEACTGTNSGSEVCINCKTQGTCADSAGLATLTTYCPTGQYCFEGNCQVEMPASCGCASETGCFADPNQDTDTLEAYIDCRNSENPAYVLCSESIFELAVPEKCGCSGPSTSCPSEPSCAYFIGNNNPCEHVYYCQMDESISPPVALLYPNTLCPEGQCYDEDSCDCQIVLTTESPTVTSCPACQKIPDENNQPSGYLNCIFGPPLSGNEIPGECEAGWTFNLYPDGNCECVLECPACGKLEVPGGNCTDYYYCAEEGDPILTKCINENHCFNSTTCQCEHATATDPPMSTTLPPCPDCGVVPDPSDPHSYFKCDPTGEIPGYLKETCPDDDVYFDDTCNCVRCPSCGYMDDPFSEDCKKYYYCKDEILAWDCQNDNFCFDNITCGCEVISTTSTTTTTTVDPEHPFCSTCLLFPNPSDPDKCYINCASPTAPGDCCPEGYIYIGEDCGCYIEPPSTSTSNWASDSTSTSTSTETSIEHPYCSETCRNSPDQTNPDKCYIDCDDPTASSVCCLTGYKYDANACDCIEELISCPTLSSGCEFYANDLTEGCADYVLCQDGIEDHRSCSDAGESTLCFDEVSCGCVDCGDCKFHIDLTDPQCYLSCPEKERVGCCPIGTEPDAVTCGCISTQVGSTTQAPWPPTCQACGYAEDTRTPEEDDYVYCASGSYAEATCPATTCFFTSACKCDYCT